MERSRDERHHRLLDRTSGQVAVVDIDGVLADVRHRLHHLRTRPKNWDGFFAAASRDEPLPEGFAVARELARRYELLYLSGRPERTRRQTESWLAEHDAPEGRLRLRRDGDRRPGRLVKLEVLRGLGGPRAVAVVVDDDPVVCAAARDAGYTVLEADWGRPESQARNATLLDAQERDGRT